MRSRIALFFILLLLASTGFAREQIPQQLGELVMGKAPPCKYLNGQCDGPEQVWYVNDDAVPKMWLSLAPEMPSKVKGATVTAYKGRVVQVIFWLLSSVKFEDVNRSFTNRFGNGMKKDVRTKSTSNSPDCPKLYLIQNWSYGNGELTVQWDKEDVVYVILRDNLARTMDKDPEYEPEDAPCLDD
jgi:hypothetical protein